MESQKVNKRIMKKERRNKHKVRGAETARGEINRMKGNDRTNMLEIEGNKEQKKK